MKVAIMQILTDNNKSIYWLSKELDCDYQSLKKLCNNESTKISLTLMENICKKLNCSPSDIFKIE